MKQFGNGVCAFGQTYANEVRRRRPRCGDKWHLDEVFLTIRGERHYLWRAVDQDGNVLDMRVAEPTEQEGRETLFPQTARKVAICSACDHHR
jgi:putative transposase